MKPAVERFSINQKNRVNLSIARAMVLYWQDVVEGKLPRVLWEELDDKIREHYIILQARKLNTL